MSTKNIDIIRDKTFDDAMQLLNKYKKACIVRPTGFGKTGICTRFVNHYKKVIYLYPTYVITDAVMNFYYNWNVPEGADIPNVQFISYNALARMKEKDMKKLKNIDLIIADECHCLGAEGASVKIKELLKQLPNVHLLGATATPERMDLYDVVDDMFDNRVVFEYTLHDSFKDKNLQKPYYCFCSYGVADENDIIKQTRHEITRLNLDGDKEIEDLLRSRLIEISNLAKMDNIIRETCNKYAYDTNYMKFIIFFANYNHIHQKGNDVTSWFQNAYPNHKINTLTITSETKECINNLKKLSTLTYQDKTIDLIFCVDMMNMGYHVSNLTGIVMYRGTHSGNIYTQQLGRALNSGNSHAGIVFDVVDNIHRESIYSVLGRERNETTECRIKWKKLEKKAEKIGKDKLSDEEKKELKRLRKRFANENENRWWTNANKLEPEDLVATGHEATYRQLIAKTVAEPISMRCRQAYAHWKEQGGDDSTFTPAYVMSRQAPDAVPLSPFARCKNVSIAAVLNEIFGEDDYTDLIKQYETKSTS